MLRKATWKSMVPCKEAYRLGLISDESSALRMLEDRNLSVHLYDHKTSREVFDRIRTLYLKLFREALEKMKG